MSSLGLQVSVVEFRVSGVGLKVWGVTSGFGPRVSGLSPRVSGFSPRVSGFGSRGSGLGFRVWGRGDEKQIQVRRDDRVPHRARRNLAADPFPRTETGRAGGNFGFWVPGLGLMGRVNVCM